MDKEKETHLTRPIHPMPAFIQQALLERGLMEAYHQRPAYQQNDYIGWINRAKRPETCEKRLAQMLVELEQGDAYMKMVYHSKDKTKA
jgi:hypothetical protein